jgi:hypothetical protein
MGNFRLCEHGEGIGELQNWFYQFKEIDSVKLEFFQKTIGKFHVTTLRAYVKNMSHLVNRMPNKIMTKDR